MKLRCTVQGGKKILVIPSYYADMFEEGEKYDGMTCSKVARYLCLIVPAYRWDEFEEGKEYDVKLS